MERNLKATVRYDGGGFAGWQVQPGQRTVQGAIEEALARIAGEPVRITGAGRTDAGVHALGQVFAFRWAKPQTPAQLRRSLSRMLGPELRVTDIVPAPPEFHPIRDATAKRYAYTFCRAKEPDPFSARYAWCISPDIAMDRVEGLAARFVGKHDFAGFRCSGSTVKTTVREIYAIDLVPGGVIAPMDAQDLWRLEFYGNGFLYKMVRNIVGTVIDVTAGRLPETVIHERLNAPGPYEGYTAPAHGLALAAVEYGAGKAAGP